MNASRRFKQGGAALIVALAFMLILSIIGVAAMQNATMQERMAGNSKDVNIAFQAAEIAVRHAEATLPDLKPLDFDGSEGAYLSCPDPDDDRQACQSPDWNDYDSKGWVLIDGKLSAVSRQPEFIIEQIAGVDDPTASLDADKTVSLKGYYRVTARGFGLNERSMVVLETTYKRVEK